MGELINMAKKIEGDAFLVLGGYIIETAGRGVSLIGNNILVDGVYKGSLNSDENERSDTAKVLSLPDHRQEREEV